MPIKSATPYLFFNGNADKAIALYERTLGARTECLQRWGEHPECGAQADKNRVMHSQLRLGEAVVMLSDCPTDEPQSTGGNVQITLEFDDPVDMSRKFDALATTGKIGMPIQDTFWGAKFGTLTDEFGIHWLFNCTITPQ